VEINLKNKTPLIRKILMKISNNDLIKSRLLARLAKMQLMAIISKMENKLYSNLFPNNFFKREHEATVNLISQVQRLCSPNFLHRLMNVSDLFWS